MCAMADVINSIKGGVEDVDGGDYISTEGSTKTNIKLSLNVSDEIKDSDNTVNTVPTTNAVKTYVDGMVNDPTAYVFPNLSAEDRKYFIIYDAWQNPVSMSDSFRDELIDGYRLFDYRAWKKFHIDMPKLETQYRMFHSNYNLVSFKSDISSLSKFNGMFHGDTNLQYVDVIISSIDEGIGNDNSNCFASCNNLKHITITSDNFANVDKFLSLIPSNVDIKNKRIVLKKTDGAKYTDDEIKTIINADTVRNNGWKINQ